MSKNKRVNKLKRMTSEEAFYCGYNRGYGRCLALVIWAIRKKKPLINEEEVKTLFLSKRFTIANKSERLLLKKISGTKQNEKTL